MKHLFIINPAAGRGQAIRSQLARIREAAQTLSLAHEIYITKSRYDATRFVARRCGEGGALRVYAVGGDGTLAETAAGLYGHPNAELAVIACGSGNDFARQFSRSEQFSDVYAMIRAKPRLVDMLRLGERLCLNNVAIGIDSKTVYNRERFQAFGRISGPMAYNLALAYSFFGNITFPLTITVDDEEPVRKNTLIVVAANGRYYGGGFCPAPLAVPDDGLIDCVIADRVSRLRFLRAFPRFKRGTHLNAGPKYDFISCRRASRIRLQSEKPVPVQADGECILTNDVTVEILPAAIRFCTPE